MHQSLDHDSPPATELSLRRALARDLNVPPTAVTSTLATFATVARVARGRDRFQDAATLDTWRCIVAPTHALAAK